MKFTQRENLLKALRREGPECVPVDMGLCPSQVADFKERFGHEDYGSYFGMAYRGNWIPYMPTYEDGRELHGRDLPEEITFDGWGVGHSKGSEAAKHMTRLHHPLQGEIALDQVENYPMPGIDDKDVARVRKAIDAAHEAGLAFKGHMAQTIWETAWAIRSMEELMMDMMDGDDKAALLLDRVMQCSIDRAVIFAEAGADMIHLGDDIGTQHGPMMSVDMWHDWLKPRLKKVIDAAKSVKPDILIFYHSCGDVREFLEELVDVGIDILNPIQPECMTLQEAHDRIGDRVSFWGTIGTQQLLPFGTPEEVRAEVIKNVNICGRKGGIVIGPTHLVEPEVPWENLVALRDAAAAIDYRTM